MENLANNVGAMNLQAPLTHQQPNLINDLSLKKITALEEGLRKMKEEANSTVAKIANKSFVFWETMRHGFQFMKRTMKLISYRSHKRFRSRRVCQKIHRGLLLRSLSKMRREHHQHLPTRAVALVDSKAASDRSAGKTETNPTTTKTIVVFVSSYAFA